MRTHVNECKITADDRYCVTTQKMQETGNSCFNGDLYTCT